MMAGWLVHEPLGLILLVRSEDAGAHAGATLESIAPWDVARWLNHSGNRMALLEVHAALRGGFPNVLFAHREKDEGLCRAIAEAFERRELVALRLPAPQLVANFKKEDPFEKEDSAREEDETFLYKMRLHDEMHGPCENIAYKLELSTGEVVRDKVTGGGGLLEQRLPKRQHMIRLTYKPAGSDVEFVREIMVLPETVTDSDYVAHLWNLGFGSDEKRAVLAFQAAHKDLTLTGTLDDATKAAIQSAVTEDLKAGTRG
ncbi:hypothetical protein LZC95_08330 [Pendulispora brunnea]|uniref:Peptidoglycan binding-like domain-containing protein n=1 Tax=Pendulispora brunnea TaxID=2905690 RepID=A0ABZ2KDR1_9BACT